MFGVIRFLKVAVKTCRFGDLDVRTLYDLRVAACTLEGFTSS